MLGSDIFVCFSFLATRIAVYLTCAYLLIFTLLRGNVENKPFSWHSKYVVSIYVYSNIYYLYTCIYDTGTATICMFFVLFATLTMKMCTFSRVLNWHHDKVQLASIFLRITFNVIQFVASDAKICTIVKRQQFEIINYRHSFAIEGKKQRKLLPRFCFWVMLRYYPSPHSWSSRLWKNVYTISRYFLSCNCVRFLLLDLIMGFIINKFIVIIFKHNCKMHRYR